VSGVRELLQDGSRLLPRVPVGSTLPRGITRIPALDRPGYEAWNIPSVCPWLDEKTNKCGIYETRPEVCRKWDGFQHPEVDCAWRDV
jgi:hypothetical protein